MPDGSAVQVVTALIDDRRLEQGLPDHMPVIWQGIGMSIEEAKLAIATLEQICQKQQSSAQRLQIAGEIVTLAVGGTGAIAMLAGVSLLLVPHTALAGTIALISGAGAIGLGSVIGTGIGAIGTSHSPPHSVDADLHTLKNALIATLSSR